MYGERMISKYSYSYSYSYVFVLHSSFRHRKCVPKTFKIPYPVAHLSCFTVAAPGTCWPTTRCLYSWRVWSEPSGLSRLLGRGFTLSLPPKTCLYVEEDNPKVSWDGILERHFLSRFLGMNSSLLRLEFSSGFLPSFFRSTKCILKVNDEYRRNWIRIRIRIH